MSLLLVFQGIFDRDFMAQQFVPEIALHSSCVLEAGTCGLASWESHQNFRLPKKKADIDSLHITMLVPGRIFVIGSVTAATIGGDNNRCHGSR